MDGPVQFGLMQDIPLLISSFINYADRYHGSRQIISRRIEDGSLHQYSYREAHARARQLANALTRWGVRQGDRVATLAWNSYRHFELFYGASGMGAVLHTVNPRLFENQISYIINHAEDSILFLDLDFVDMAERQAPSCPTVKQYVILTDRKHMPQTGLPGAVSYEDFISDVDDDFIWPDFDERLASSLCYTSGTTGNPKGVLYSHRSTVLHAMAAAQKSAFNVGAHDVIMPLSPMYHANAWSLPYLSAMVGANLVLVGCDMSGKAVYEMIDTAKVTFANGVPTVWSMLFEYVDKINGHLDSLQTVVIGGSAVPPWMIERFAAFGVTVAQVWGMTETSPLGTMSTPTPRVDALAPKERSAVMEKQGRGQFMLDLKITDDAGMELPHDGETSGALWVRGPWACSGYFRGEGGKVLDGQGFLPTGDVATIDPHGYMKIVDRTKDVIKSGGEWVSSIDVENAAEAHPDVAQAAVIGIYHPRWEERPLLLVVSREGRTLTKKNVLDFLSDKIVKWWMPDDVIFMEDIPLTATGKIDKKYLRDQFRDYAWPQDLKAL